MSSNTMNKKSRLESSCSRPDGRERIETSLSVLLDKAPPVLAECIMVLGVGNWYYGNVQYSSFVPVYDDAIKRIDECSANQVQRITTLTNLLTSGLPADSYPLPPGPEQVRQLPPKATSPQQAEQPPDTSTKNRTKEQNQKVAQQIYILMKAVLDQPPNKEGNKNG